MKSLEQFQQAGQELYEGLDKGLFHGVGQHGEQATFWRRDNMIEVVPDISPPYTYTMNTRSFLEALGMGIALSREETLAPIFKDEVDVLQDIITLNVRKENSEWLMEKAIEATKRHRRGNNVGIIPAHLEPCAEAVAAEEAVRDAVFHIEGQYARYEELAAKPELTEVPV